MYPGQAQHRPTVEAVKYKSRNSIRALPKCTTPSRHASDQESDLRVAPERTSDYVPTMRIAIASDHAALDMKAALHEWLVEKGHEVADLGPDGPESVDYPDYGYKLASVVADGTAMRGIALCGSGLGISMAVNRNPKCRCAMVSEPTSARLAREHNDANVIAMGARLIGIEQAKACVQTFLETGYADADDPAGRHQRRVDKLAHPPTTESA